jgi:hypothetical protein
LILKKVQFHSIAASLWSSFACHFSTSSGLFQAS